MAYSKLIFISFLCVLAMDVFNQVSSLFGSPAWGFTFLLVLNLASASGLFIFSRKIQWKSNIPARGLLVIQLFWLWSLFTFIRGIGSAHDYWDWKVLLLGYLPSVAISLAVVLGVNLKFSAKLLRFLLFKLFPFSFLFIPFSFAYNDEFYSRLVMPVCLFVLISPYLIKKWRILVFAVAITSIAMDVSYRANALRLMIPLLLVGLFYFRPILQSKLMNAVLAGLLCIPLILLSLGVSGTFNVFAENKFDFEVGTVLQGETGTSTVSADTRTFLYREVFFSMNKRDSSYLIGEGGAAGYETGYFVDAVLNEKGRFRSEVGILNTLLYSGAIGVLFYALVLFLPAYYAINKSNNRLCKMIGLFLAARWPLSFVEEIAQFDMNFFFLWFMIGLCLSNKFREMTDEQLARYFGASRLVPSKLPKWKMPNSRARGKSQLSKL
ncbi:MAG: hypothetical protein HOO97_01045 [Sideroxydans sp.]|nr:hypothetical protein [Sideroxydans sp.]